MVTSPTRQQFAEMHHVVDYACGYGFSAFVVQEENDTHTLYGTGINTDGQLGIQLSRQSKQMELLIYPAKVALENNIRIKAIDAGRAHLAVVAENNTIYTLGNNSYGQAARRIVSDENFAKSRIANKIQMQEDIKAVTCGQDHTMILTQGGSVYACGWSSDGQTGIGTYKSTSKLTRVEGDVRDERVVKLACAGDCVLALSETGHVFGWGNSEYGQFNAVSGLDGDEQQIHTPRLLFGPERYGRIVDVAAGGSFCLFVNGKF